ncbi:hypothetical protein F2Q70_00006990 [Brassica cretica]|uniref:Uncharacterized protein n=1 Tax=Brassica cretica TaxID=69181 RepID=A0A8S9JFR6_BRACR|nr:hypothetical protein F2Q68_00000044 [Brassica cretica]KAF2612213.1 hypothetical protein F2Q70_00006990 [Brassica cretica]
MSSPQSTTSQEKLAIIDESLLHSHMEIIGDQEKMEQSTKEITTFQQEATLPLQELQRIMESTPSNMITTEIASEDDASIDSQPAINTTIDPPDRESNTHMFTRGGRSIKPTQKVQEMGWTKVNGRGKHVSRGRVVTATHYII